jgi:hypothetical protein
MAGTALEGLLLDRVAADTMLGDVEQELVLAAAGGDEALDAALGGGTGRPPDPRRTDRRAPGAVAPSRPDGMFLRSIRVSGFRGIGARATLTLPPGPGLTVVTGRNGSGKSSFAEARRAGPDRHQLPLGRQGEQPPALAGRLAQPAHG